MVSSWQVNSHAWKLEEETAVKIKICKQLSEPERGLQERVQPEG